MFIDLRPLKAYPDFRHLFLSQVVSFLGSMVSYVAIPYQVYQITKSSFVVGMLGAVQLLPILFFGLLGGSVADSMDRKKLLIISEIIMSLCSVGLAVNSYIAEPQIWVIFILTALMQAANAFHRPAMDAMTQQLVTQKDMPAVSALGSFRYSVGAVIGPALGGILTAWGGAAAAYLFDFVSFVFAILMICLIKKIPLAGAATKPGLGSIKEGLDYAVKKPELMGTYIVDIIAMTFAFPTALFPAMGEQWGGAQATGMLYSAMAVGSLITTLLSGWSGKIKFHGRAVVYAAGLWGVAVVGLGYSTTLPWALFFLVLAGGFDMVSGLYRGIIWNEVIPNKMRGRLSGIEMISYMSGPLLGNTRAGWMASLTSNAISVYSGGFLCILGVATSAYFLPKFWNYRSEVNHDS